MMESQAPTEPMAMTMFMAMLAKETPFARSLAAAEHSRSIGQSVCVLPLKDKMEPMGEKKGKYVQLCPCTQGHNQGYGEAGAREVGDGEGNSPLPRFGRCD